MRSRGFAKARPAMRLGYLVRNPVSLSMLVAIDALLWLFSWVWRRPSVPIGRPRRVLLTNGGHLGDAIIATAVLPTIREVWPEAEIGMVSASWSRMVFEDHPLIDHLHVVDHWRSNRAAGGRWEKVQQYIRTRRRAVHEIAAVEYDLGVDLYPFVPNSAGLLWSARIPVRYGFRSGGFGALFTRTIPWVEDDRQIAEHHSELLTAVDTRFSRTAPVRYSLRSPQQGAISSPAALSGKEYLLLHMGAGLEQKEWRREYWSVLVAELLADGHMLAFSGTGVRQAADVRAVINGRAGCVDLSDQLSWDQFVEVVRGARLVISVDSVTGHIAAAVDTPVVVLISGINPISQWRPLAREVEMVTGNVPCAPCHRSRGCASMACMRDISVASVVAAVNRSLAHPQASVNPMVSRVN